MRTHVIKNFDFNEEIMSDTTPVKNVSFNSQLVGGMTKINKNTCKTSDEELSSHPVPKKSIIPSLEKKDKQVSNPDQVTAIPAAEKHSKFFDKSAYMNAPDAADIPTDLLLM
jgi:hypothetical protein